MMYSVRSKKSKEEYLSLAGAHAAAHLKAIQERLRVEVWFECDDIAEDELLCSYELPAGGAKLVIKEYQDESLC